MTISSTDRCKLSDLLVSECSCRIHGKPEKKYTRNEIQVWFLAWFDSRCQSCEDGMHEGDQIARTYDGEYVCKRCVL